MLGRSLRAQGARAEGPPAAGLGHRGRPRPALAPYRGLIADELNVKEVRLVEEVDEVADLVLQVNPAVLGPGWGPVPSTS